MRLGRFTLAVSAAALGATLLIGPAGAAPDYVLDAAGIEQTVLRAQMPRTLGPRHQNTYFSWARNDTGYHAVLCYSATGSRYQLPHPRMGGGVSYSVGPNIVGSVTVHQYADQLAADAALAMLKGIDCPDSTAVRTDTGVVVMGTQTSDFTDSSHSGIESVMTYKSMGGDGLATIMEIRTTTQAGLVVVQTEVHLVSPAATHRNLDRAVALNRQWHAQAVAAYRAFGSGNSR